MLTRHNSAVLVLAAAFMLSPTLLVAEETGQSDDMLLTGPQARSKQDRSNRRFDGSRRRGDKGSHIQQILRELDLNQPQQNEARSILENHKQQFKQWRSKYGKELDELRRQMEQLRAKQRKRMADAPKMEDALNQLRPSLNAGQQAILDEQLKRMSDRGKGVRHDRRGKRDHRSNRNPDDPPNDKLDLETSD